MTEIDYRALAERAFIKDLITRVYPKGVVSIVCDTFDFWRVLTEDVKYLKEAILSRDGKVVFRPDSGDPEKIICGDSDGATKEERLGAVRVLKKYFGTTETSTGHLLLDSHVGLIYGDSINYNMAERILGRLAENGLASANIVFGIGSYTYQYVTRDTWGFAVKATYGVVDGEARNIFKRPKTDNGEKFSAKGLLFVSQKEDSLSLEQEVTWEKFASIENLLSPVYRDGKLLINQDLQTIRNRVKHACLKGTQRP